MSRVGVTFLLALGAGGIVALVFGNAVCAALVAAAVAALVTAIFASRPTARAKDAVDTRLAAQELVELVVDAAPDAVLLFSDVGLIRYANAGARELFFAGVHPEGENFLTLVARAPESLREALLGEADRLFTVEVEGRSETYHVSRRNFSLTGELHTILVVKYMTREIARREVDVLKRVVRVISHEVNNSLAPISSLVHSARLVVQSPDFAQRLGIVFDTIEERAKHLRIFLEGYAAIARLPKPRPRWVEPGPFLAQLAALHPEVKIHSAPLSPGHFDPAQIEQVVINLVKNARESGSDPTEVDLTMRTKAGGETELEVCDRGHGFSDEALKNALLPLYTTKERGSGMGLALSREILEAHGGSLVLTNRGDGGASVRANLPGTASTEARLQRSRLTLGR